MKRKKSMSRKSLFAAVCVALSALLSVCCAACNKTSPPAPEHTHGLTHTETKTATCKEAGYNEYWKCGECGKLFSDAEATSEIAAPVVLEKTDHNYTAYKKVETGHKRACEFCGTEKEGDVEKHEHILIVAEQPKKTEYFNGETFDPEGIKVEMNCVCGDSEDVTAQAEIDSAVVSGETTSVAIRYGTQETIVQIVPKEVRLVQIEAQLKTDVVYYENGKAAPSANDFSVKGIYNNGTERVLAASEYAVSTDKNFKTNGGKIKVQVTNRVFCELDYALVKIVPTEMEIKSYPVTMFEAGEIVVFDGLVLTVTYNDGSIRDITEGYTCEDLGKAFTADTTAVVTYTLNGVGKSVNLPLKLFGSAEGLQSIAFVNEINVACGEELSSPDLRIAATYSDGSTHVIAESKLKNVVKPSGQAESGVDYTYSAEYAGRTVSETYRISHFAHTDISKTAGNGTLNAGGYWGNLNEKTVFQVKFDSAAAQKVSIVLDIANGYYKGGKMLEEQLNQVIIVKIDGREVEIDDGVKLSPNDTGNWEAFEERLIGAMNVSAGERTLTIGFKTLIKNGYNSYVTGNLRSICLRTVSA